MALEGAIRPGDVVFEDSGLKFVLDRMVESILGPVQVDFEDGRYGGFVIKSDRVPNSSCS